MPPAALPCAVPGCEASIVEDDIESPERWRRSGTLAGYCFGTRYTRRPSRGLEMGRRKVRPMTDPTEDRVRDALDLMADAAWQTAIGTSARDMREAEMIIAAALETPPSVPRPPACEHEWDGRQLPFCVRCGATR
jgi:hypothetical protein